MIRTLPYSAGPLLREVYLVMRQLPVNPETNYVYVKLKDDNNQLETVVVARDCLNSLNVDNYRIVKELKGSELVGLRYRPPFKLTNLKEYPDVDNLYRVWSAEFVSVEDGTGVLHVAPAYGEDDLAFGKEHDLPILITVDEFGRVKNNIGLPTEIEGLFFKKADEKITGPVHPSKQYLCRRNYQAHLSILLAL